MNKKLISAGVGAVGVATLALGALGPLSAQAASGPNATYVCLQVPAALAGSMAQQGAATNAKNTAAGILATRQSELATATTSVANALTAYIQASDRGDNLTLTGNAFNASFSLFSDRAVAENNAMTSFFETQRSLYVANLGFSFYDDFNKGLCTTSTPTSTTTSTTAAR